MELSSGFGLIKCFKCNHLQPPPPTQSTPTSCPNYYTLLLPQTTKFKINLKELKDQYLRLQGQVHPDKLRDDFGGNWSSWINRANETLKNPLQRAIYLINLHENQQSNNEDDTETSSINEDTTDSTSDCHDISLVLEVRESLAESLNDPQSLLSLKNENDERIRKCTEELEVLLDERKDFEGAKRCVNRLRYWMGVEEEFKRLGL